MDKMTGINAFAPFAVKVYNIYKKNIENNIKFIQICLQTEKAIDKLGRIRYNTNS